MNYLSLVQNCCDRIRYIDNASRFSVTDKQKAVRCFKDQVLQFLIGEKGGLVGTISTCVSSS